jgi:hypothetical protein
VHQPLFVVLLLALAYASYCLVRELVSSGFTTSTVVAFVSLFASTYTFWWVHLVPADISVLVTRRARTPVESEPWTLQFYNHGTVQTTLLIDEIVCSDDELEVVPSDFPDTGVAPRGYAPVVIRVQNRNTISLKPANFPAQIQVTFRFWRGSQEVCRNVPLQLKLLERST